PRSEWVARSAVVRAHGTRAARTTVPLWTAHVADNGTLYTYEMVGRNPHKAQAHPAVSIPTVLVPLKLVFSSFGDAAFDANAADPPGSPPGSAPDLVPHSPAFLPHPLYADTVRVGTGQYASNFQRANFWSDVQPGGANPKYAVNLKLADPIAFTVPISGGSV